MSTFSNISISTSFNYSVSAWICGDENSKKLAVLLPGFLDSKDYTHLKKLGELLSDQGYLVISFDPLGTWQSKALTEFYTMSNWLKEINDAISWVTHQHTSIKKIVLIGHSMGGMLSMWYAAGHPEISAVVSIMGGPPFIRPQTYEERMVKWKAVGKKVSHRDNPSNPQEIVTIELPFSFVEDAQHYDIRQVVGKITSPTLIIGGEKDALVDVKDLEEIKNLFSKDVATLTVLQEIGHDYRKTPEFIDRVNSKILAFLNEKV